MKGVLIIFLIILTLNSFAQKKKFFRDAPTQIERLQALSAKAWNGNDSTKAAAYSDSIENYIKNSYIDEYKFQTFDGRVVDTRKIKKPIFLLTTASWCSPCVASVEPLNKIVDEYHRKVAFIVLFWDEKDKVASLSSKYNNKMFLIPSEKSSTDGMMGLDISGFQHMTGYPGKYLIRNRKIVYYSVGGPVSSVVMRNSEGKFETIAVSTKEEVFNNNYKTFKEAIEKAL